MSIPYVYFLIYTGLYIIKDFTFYLNIAIFILGDTNERKNTYYISILI